MPACVCSSFMVVDVDGSAAFAFAGRVSRDETKAVVPVDTVKNDLLVSKLRRAVFVPP